MLIPTVLRITAGKMPLRPDESGTVEVNSGGSLTVTGNSKVGNNGTCTGTLIVNTGGSVDFNGGWVMVAGNSDVTGVLDVAGGSVTTSSHLWAAVGAGSTADIDVHSGGVLTVGSMLGLGTIDAVNPGGGNATLTVGEGGTLALTNIHGGGTSIQPGSVLDLIGSGQLTLPGDFVSVLQGYVDNNYITGNGVAGAVSIDLTTNPGFTTAMEIPEPATMILLGLGGLLIRRKK